MVFGIIALVEALHSKHLAQLSLTATTAVVCTAWPDIPRGSRSVLHCVMFAFCFSLELAPVFVFVLFLFLLDFVQ